MGLFRRRAPVQRQEDPGPGRERPQLLVANLQGVGGREDQQDSFAVRNGTDPARQESEGLLAVVADGMGGMLDGRAVSELAVDTLLRRFSAMGDTPVPNWFYESACIASDQAFQRFGGCGGSTLAAVHIRRGLLHWISVGDSAIFLKRNGGVFQLNREHTCLNRFYERELERETIDKRRAEQDEDAPRLTSFLGMDRLRDTDLNLRPMALRQGDVLLLCSDGVSGVLTPAELLEAMSLPPDQGCALLEAMVLEKDLPEQDNYTGIMISVL